MRIHKSLGIRILHTRTATHEHHDPAQFIATWKNNPLTERAGAQPHFDDLCELLGVDKPRDSDNYCFERGAKKAGGGDGWADVWKRGFFGWENKKPGRDLSVYAFCAIERPLNIMQEYVSKA